MRKLFIIFALLLVSQCLAGNFTITNPSAVDVRAASIYGKTGYETKNYGQRHPLRVGYWYGEIRTLLDFKALADSMQQVVTDSGSVVWDSAIVFLVCYNLASANDSIYISVFKVERDWVEGFGTGAMNVEDEDTCGVCWDSANAIGYTGCSGDAANWGTNGCNNTTTDRSATREVFGSYLDSFLFESSIPSGDTIDFYISGATVMDTLGAGLIFVPVDYGDPGPPGNGAVVAGFYSDDYASASKRPQLQVWYHAVSGKIVGKSTVGKSRL